jgi:hypothetical protein
MEDFVMKNLNWLLLVSGILMLAISIPPIFSRKYFDWMTKGLWKGAKIEASNKTEYLDVRYFTQIRFVIFGILLTGYALYSIFF